MEATILRDEQQKRREWAENWLEKAKKSCPHKRERVLELAEDDQEHLLVLTALFPQVNKCFGGHLPQKDVFPHLQAWCHDPAFLGVTLREIIRWVDILGEDIFFIEPRWAQKTYVLFGSNRLDHFRKVGVATQTFKHVLQKYSGRSPHYSMNPDNFFLLDILYFFDDESLIENEKDFIRVAAMFKHWCYEMNYKHQQRPEGFPTTHYRILLLSWWRAIRRELPQEDLDTLLLEGRYLTWQERGFSPEETLEWLRVGFPADYSGNLTAWKKLAFKPREAKEWLDEGWPLNGPHKAKQLNDKYAPLGYSISDMVASHRLVKGFAREGVEEEDYATKKGR